MIRPNNCKLIWNKYFIIMRTNRTALHSNMHCIHLLTRSAIQGEYSILHSRFRIKHFYKSKSLHWPGASQCLYGTVIQGYIWWEPISVSGNFQCAFRDYQLWRRKKLGLSPHRKLCHGSRLLRRKHPREDVPLPWTMGFGWEYMTT